MRTRRQQISGGGDKFGKFLLFFGKFPIFLESNIKRMFDFY